MSHIKPVNNHILIEPLKHESFIASDKGTYQEVGIVIAVTDGLLSNGVTGTYRGEQIGGVLKIGDKVYFDAWLASKFPKNDKEFFWLVDWKDVKAVEANDEISK